MISPENVGDLVEKWRVRTAYASEPIVHGGCVFVTNGELVQAYALDTGIKVWSTDVEAAGSFAVTVVDDRVHLSVNNGGRPQAVALDVRDGKVLWTSQPLDFGNPVSAQSSGFVHNGVQAVFTTAGRRSGYGLFDAGTGELLHSQTTYPERAFKEGHAGGGVWGTPTFDPIKDHLYVGTADPISNDREHELSVSIIKIDLDRRRQTFGAIVDSYKGDPESLTGYDNPVCQNFHAVPGAGGSAQTCGQFDVDFGNGPTLWRKGGRLYLAQLQKSGTLHMVDAETMTGVWKKTVGTHNMLTYTGGNYNRIATDGKTLWVYANPTFFRALDAATGTERWLRPHGYDGIAGSNTVLANGVVYHSLESNTIAYHSVTGAELWRGYPVRQSPTPNNTNGNQGGGTAVAGNRLVSNINSTLTVFALRD